MRGEKEKGGKEGKREGVGRGKEGVQNSLLSLPPQDRRALLQCPAGCRAAAGDSQSSHTHTKEGAAKIYQVEQEAWNSGTLGRGKKKLWGKSGVLGTDDRGRGCRREDSRVRKGKGVLVGSLCCCPAGGESGLAGRLLPDRYSGEEWRPSQCCDSPSTSSAELGHPDPEESF